MYYADWHVPIRAAAAVMPAVFRTAFPLHGIMIMTETRAHNSAHLRVLSGVWYYPLSDMPDDDWWKSARSICRETLKRGRGGGGEGWKSGVDRNYEASAATSVPHQTRGEEGGGGNYLVSRPTISPVSNVPCRPPLYEEIFCRACARQK